MRAYISNLLRDNSTPEFAIAAARSNLVIPAAVQGRCRQKRRISMKDYSVPSTEYRESGDIETEGGGRQRNKMERDCLHILSRQLI